MEVFSLKNVLHMFYQSNHGKMSEKWRNNLLGTGKEESITTNQVQRFLILTRDKVIQEFLKYDRCYKLADNYLLSMVFIYFVRAKLPPSDYTRTNFFVALYLAHDIEEDDEDLKLSFVDWGIGATSTKDFDYFLSLRDKLWEAMDFRACVSLKTCKKVMDCIEDCDLWERERDPAHGGAVRSYDPNVEKCKNCDRPDDDEHFYESDCELSEEEDFEEKSEEEESVSSVDVCTDDELFGLPPKRARINEE